MERRWDVLRTAHPIAVAGGATGSIGDPSDDKAVTKYFESVIETFNMYLSGDIWGYRIVTDDGETLDSLWGIYGREYAEQEAEKALEYMREQEGVCGYGI